MKIQNPPAKQSIIQRLRRIEGQVRGVQAMLEQERDCQEVLQQLAAIRSAVQGVNRAFLKAYAAACLCEMEDDLGADGLQVRGQRDKMVQELIAFLDKAP